MTPPIYYLLINLFFVACVPILGWWLKSRLEESISHEYDKLSKLFESKLKRIEILHSERLDAFKALSEKIVNLRNYCHARVAEINGGGDFSERTIDISDDANLSLLAHDKKIREILDKKELFISDKSRKCFESLFDQLNIGFSLELNLSDIEMPGLNADQLYLAIYEKVEDTHKSLYADLSFSEELLPHN